MKKIVTIGGGNGQSNMLEGLYNFVGDQLEITSIVSMSDDGRTTGELMARFKNELGLHLPPPGDLRRCLFMMSDSPMRESLQKYLETIIEDESIISEVSIAGYFQLVGAPEALMTSLGDIPLHDTLPLHSSIAGLKVGNLLMANLYYNLEGDYNKMLDMMHEMLQVKAKIIPVTTQKARIRAILGNGDIIETQDRISNDAAYSSGIADLELMEDSQHAYQHKDVFKAIKQADAIIISPGDLFTSTISNLVIGGVKEVISKTDAQIIYIGNNTNKGGETQGLTYLDFINKIERFLGKRIDTFICNNKRLELSEQQRNAFQNDQSVKGGDFLYLSQGEKSELTRRKTRYIEADLLDRTTLYKHDTQALTKLIHSVL